MSKCPHQTQRVGHAQVNCLELMEADEPLVSSDTARVSTTTEVQQMKTEPGDVLRLEDIIRGLTTTPQGDDDQGDNLLDDYDIEDLDLDALDATPEEAVLGCSTETPKNG